jgi:hypothetical protein
MVPYTNFPTLPSLIIESFIVVFNDAGTGRELSESALQYRKVEATNCPYTGNLKPKSSCVFWPGKSRKPGLMTLETSNGFIRYD